MVNIFSLLTEIFMKVMDGDSREKINKLNFVFFLYQMESTDILISDREKYSCCI